MKKFRVMIVKKNGQPVGVRALKEWVEKRANFKKLCKTRARIIYF